MELRTQPHRAGDRVATLVALLVALSAPALLPAAAAAETYYVAPTGDDAHDGSISTPWATPHHAENVAVAGDTVYFRGGEYFIYDFVYFNTNAGEATAPITFASYPGEQATIVYDRTAPITDLTTQPIFCVARPYLIFERLRVTQSPASWDALIYSVAEWRGNSGFSVWASNTTIRGCEIFAVSGQGIFSAQSTAGGTYEANYIHHVGNHNNLDHGMYLCGNDELIVNNLVTDCAAYGLQIAGYDTVVNMRVFNNVFARSYRSGLILWKDLDGVAIANNIFYRNRLYGIASYYAHGSGVVIDHNLFFEDGIGTIDYGVGHSDYTYTETASITGVSPEFVDDTTDYHLSAGSPAVDTGATIAEVTKDYDGVARPQGAGYDIGAFEYVDGGGDADAGAGEVDGGGDGNGADDAGGDADDGDGGGGDDDAGAGAVDGGGDGNGADGVGGGCACTAAAMAGAGARAAAALAALVALAVLGRRARRRR